MECLLKNLDKDKNCTTIEFNNVPNRNVEMFEEFLEELQRNNIIQDYELQMNTIYKIYFNELALKTLDDMKLS